MTQQTHTKTFQKTDAIKFLQTAEFLGIEHGALCVKLGYATNASSEWIKTGQMPFVAGLACDALLNGVPMPRPKAYIITPGDKADTVLAVLKAMNVSCVELKV